MIGLLLWFDCYCFFCQSSFGAFDEDFVFTLCDLSDPRAWVCHVSFFAQQCEFSLSFWAYYFEGTDSIRRWQRGNGELCDAVVIFNAQEFSFLCSFGGSNIDGVFSGIEFSVEWAFESI